MSSLLPHIGSKTLQTLLLPGTHDSGTYQLQNSIGPDADVNPDLEEAVRIADELGIPLDVFITPWSKAQDMTLYQQAMGGIRYFDLRAAYVNGLWQTAHFELGVPIQTILTDLNQFLTQHTKEIIVVEISHFIGTIDTGAEKSLIAMIKNTLGNKLFPRTGGFAATINQMVANNQRAVVTFEKTDVIATEPLLWPPSTLINTYANSDNLQTMISYNTQQAAAFTANPVVNQLYKLSWTLTPSTSDFENGVNPFSSEHSLIDLADSANPSLDSWFQSTRSAGKSVGNIVLLDHFESSNVIQLVITANQQ